MITVSPRRSRRLMLCGAIALTGLGLASSTVVDAAAPPRATIPAVLTTLASPDNTGTTATAGTDAAGTDTAGTDTAGTDTAGTDTAGTDTAGTDTAGTDTAGIDASDAEWVAESNAQQDQLAAYLVGRGIADTVVQDGDSHWVDVDYLDQSASDAVDDFYWSLYPVAQAEIDAENTTTDALATYLTDHGIAVTTSTDRHGYHSVDWNYDDPAAEMAVEDFYWDQYPTSAADIASINAGAEAEVAYLTNKGFTATIETDRHGIESSIYDGNNDAIWTALGTYWSTLYGG